MANISKPNVTPSTPTRNTTFFTVGGGQRNTPSPTSSTGPNIGTAQQTPTTWNIIGVDSETVQTYVPAATGAGQFVHASTTVPFKNLDTNIVFGPNDLVWLLVTPNIITDNTASLLPLGAVAVGQGNSSGVLYNGPQLLAGIKYDSYQAVVTIYTWSLAAYASNTAYVIYRYDAVLYNLPG